MTHSIDELVAQLHYNPTDNAAFLALRAHYREVQDDASLCNLLETWAGHAQDDVAAAQALFEAAELVDSRLRDAGRATHLLEQALERNPAHFEAAERLQVLYDQYGYEDKLIALLQRRAQAIEQVRLSPRVVADVYYQIGQTWERRFGSAETAIAHYQRAFEVDPTFVQGISAARVLYEQQGNIRAALTLYDLEASVEPDPVRKAVLCRAAATLRLQEGDMEGAAAALRSALGLVPEDLSVMHELSSVLLKKAEQDGSPDQALADRQLAAELLFQLAQRADEQYAQPYLVAALDADPGHAGALALLEQYDASTGDTESIALRWIHFLQVVPSHPFGARVRIKLAQVYAAAGQLQDAIQSVEPLFHQGDVEAAKLLAEYYAQAGREADAAIALERVLGSLPPKERVMRLQQMLHRQLSRGAVDAAAPIAREIVEHDPTDAETFVFLEDYYRKHELFLELRDLLQLATRAPGLSAESKKLRLKEVAAISEAVLGDWSTAVSAWRAMLVFDPADVEAQLQLKRVLSAAGRWDDLLQILEREVMSTNDSTAKAMLLLDIGRIYLDQKNESSLALQELRKAYAIDSSTVEIHECLVRALLASGAIDEAVVMLRARAKQEIGESRARVLLFLAAVLDERLDDTDEAYRICERVLQDDPSSMPALQRMQQIAERTADQDRLMQVLADRAAISVGEEQSALFQRMGDVAADTLNDADLAFQRYADALYWSASVRDVLESMYQLAQQTGRLDDLVELLETRANDIVAGGNRHEVYRAIARIASLDLQDDERAEGAWKSMLALGDDEEALRALRARYATRQDHEGVLAVLGRLAYCASDAVERRDLVLERAKILAEKLDRRKEAIGVLQELVRTPDRSHIPALFYLASLCEAESNHEALVEALVLQRQCSDDPVLRLRATQRIAELYQHHIGDDEAALRELFAWTEMDPADPEPLRRLLVLLEFNGRSQDLVRCIDQLVVLEHDPAAIEALKLRAADMTIQSLGDVNSGWDRLESLTSEGNAVAESKLRDLALATGQATRFAALVEKLGEQAESTADRVRRGLQAARIYHEHARDAESAMRLILSVSDLDPTHPEVLRSAREVAESLDRWDDLLGMYERARAAASDDRGRLDPILNSTHVVLHARRDLARAQYLMAQAVALGVRTPSLMDYIEERVASLGDGEPEVQREAFRMLVQVYRALASDKDMEPDVGADLLGRASVLLRVQLHDIEAAKEAIEQAARLAGREVKYLDMWQQMIETSGDWQGFESKLALLARDALEPNIAAELLRRRAEVLVQHVQQFSEAADVLRKLIKLRPGDREAAEQLLQCLLRTERYQDLLVEAHRQLEKESDDERQWMLWRHVARAWTDGIKNTREAIKAWERVQALRPSDEDAKRHLERLTQELRDAKAQQDSGLVALPGEVSAQAGPSNAGLVDRPAEAAPDEGIKTDETDSE
jgi:tetratricopeptide (TPR) repeat protein